MTDRHIFYVHIDGTPSEHASFESAARHWDAETYARGRSVPGGIAIQTYRDGERMVRDGWLVHVHSDGTTYISPHLTPTA